MKRHRLSDAEERQLAQIIREEAAAMGLKGQKLPKETRDRLRITALEKIIAARHAPEEAVKTFTWSPPRRRG